MLDFSIVIPTYNRKERLLNTLKRVFNQPQSSDIYIQILNNHSNYNVKEAILEQFGTEITKNLEVVDYPVNIGGSLNICMPFFYCKTKWMWVLSDDDEITLDALEIVLKDIDKHPDVGVIKYSYTGYIHLTYVDEVYDSMEDVCGIYGKPKQTSFMLCSNSVYNLSVLEPFRGQIIAFAYNNIGAFNPICYMLDAKAGRLMLSSKVILDYKENETGKGWDSFNLYTEVGTFFDYPFKCSGHILKEFWGNGPVPPKHFFELMENKKLHKDKVKCQLAFDKVYPYMLSLSYPKKIAFKAFFYIYKWSGLNILKVLR